MLKLDSSGTVDDSFAINGLVTQTSIGGGDELITLPEQDGHVTLIGKTAGETVSITLSHYDEFGNLDPSYGNNGHFTINDNVLDGFSGRFLQIRDAVAMPDDSIVISASVSFTKGSEPWFIKVRSDGAIDTDFGDNGSLKFQPGSDLEIDSEGRILVHSRDTTIRLTASGEFDNSFGIDGRASINLPNNFEYAYSFVDSMDRIIVIGNQLSANATGESDLVGTTIYRLTSNGDLDKSFSRDGRHDYSNFTVGSANRLSPFDAGLDGEDNLIVGIGKTGTTFSARGNVSLARLRLV